MPDSPNKKSTKVIEPIDETTLLDRGQSQPATELLALPERASDDFPRSLLQNTSPFVIDFINRKIRMLTTTNIASATRKFLKLSPDFLPSGVIKCDATVVSVPGTAGETTLNSYAVPLNTISRNYAGAATSSGPRDWRDSGNMFRIFAAGRYTTDDATATVAIVCKVGTTTYHTITTTGATVTNAPWWIEWTIIVPTIGASGTAESFARAQTNNVNKDSASTATQTLDTTAAQTIALTATWSGGSAGDNISIRNFLIELMN